MSDACLKLTLEVPAAALDTVEDLLLDFGFAARLLPIRGRRTWQIEAYGPASTDPAALRAAVARAADGYGQGSLTPDIVWLPHRDWVGENQRSFAPLRIGRFFVHDSAHMGQAPANSWPILVDAATAFGTGSHETTRACLLAVDRLARHDERFYPRLVLDMGCGSGILSVAAAKAMRCRVRARDVDAEAVRATRENCLRNGVGDLVVTRPVRSDGAGLESRAYDLVLANILAEPLVRLAPRLAGCLNRGGRLVLSGLLVPQEPMVLRAYLNRGLRLVSRTVDNDWVAMVLVRPGGQGRSP